MNFNLVNLAPLRNRVHRRDDDTPSLVLNHVNMNMDMNWAKQWLSLFKASTLDQMMAFYADEFEHLDVTVGHRSTNKKDLLAFYAAFMKEGSENEFVPTAYFGSGDSGAVEWTWRVHHHGNAFGANVEGKETVLSGNSVIETRNGLIVRQYDYWDSSTMLRQLGFSIPQFQ